ncbi:MAG: enoyl-CoA hydratase/isomerase family protein [Deltaproteobacteria bacterium]|nr:MAG: enoyl-CoA hydratase/isomerase family protein [Deltaproteobacteria bacterium]
MSYEDIIYEQEEGVARITINRAKTFNSFRSQTLDEMHGALEDASGDRSVGVIVISGAGGKAFCSGGDVSEMRDLTPETGRVFLLKFLNFLQLVRWAPKPVIAAVNGYCLGGGNEINMVCDMTIATERSVFGQVGPTVGSIPVLAGTQYLPRNVGDKKAKEIIFLCQRYPAAEAQEMGWINKVVPDDKFEEEVHAWCARILEMSPQSLRIAKLSLNFEGDQLYPSFTHGIEMLASTYESEELKEGMSAFLEKRKPDFQKFRK